MYKQVGDYELKTRIGRGNYADVYLGIHLKTREQYAVKVISKEKFSHPKLIAGLESEVKIMKDFNHRNILSLKKYFSSANNFYLVLEYCAGGDLHKFIRKVGKLGEDHAFNFLTQLADGIAFLNEHGFIHRDLKTANVLLTEESVRATLKIADFGFARHLQGDTLAQTPCGTPLYMAPEVLSAGQYDAKADIWSIGCIFYEMLAGQPPFGGVNEADLLNNIRTRELRAPGDISAASVSILKRLLEKNISTRASIQDLLQLCHHVLRQSQPLTSSSQMKASTEAGPSSSADSTQIVGTVDQTEGTIPTGEVDNDTFDIDEESTFPSVPQVSKHPAAPVTPSATVVVTAANPPIIEKQLGSAKRSSSPNFGPPSDPAATSISYQAPKNNFEPINSTSTRSDNHSYSSSTPPSTKQLGVKPSLQLPPTPPPIVQPVPITASGAININGNKANSNNNANNNNSNGNNINSTSNNSQDFSGSDTDMYDDYELVNPQQQSRNNLPPLSNISANQNALNNPRKSQLSGALSPIPPTPSYIPMNQRPTSTAAAPGLPSNTPNTVNNTTINNNYINPLSPTAGPTSSAVGMPPRPIDTQQLSGNSPNPTTYVTSYLTTQNNVNNNSTTNTTTAITTPSSSFMQYQDLYQKTILQRWEVLGQIVLVATQVADHWLRQDIAASNQPTNANPAVVMINPPPNAVSSPPTAHPLLAGGVGSNPPLFSHAESAVEEEGDEEDTLDNPFAAPPSSNAAKPTNGKAGITQSLASKQSKYTLETAEQVSIVLSALSLYLHAVSLVKTFLVTVELPEDNSTNNASTNANNFNNNNSSNNGSIANHDKEIGWLVLSRLRQEVLQIYLQLQARAEQCTALLAQCISQPLFSATVAASTTTTPGNVAVASQWKASLPKAEALMLQEALRQEQAADMEEILGHVDRAQHLYEAARHLVVGVSLTFVEDMVDVRKQVAASLKALVDQLEHKILVCKQRATVVRGGFGLFSEGETYATASSV